MSSVNTNFPNPASRRRRLNDGGSVSETQISEPGINSLFTISFNSAHHLKKKDIKTYGDRLKEIEKQLKGKEIQIELDKIVKKSGGNIQRLNGQRFCNVLAFEYSNSSKIRGSYRSPSQINEVSLECTFQLSCPNCVVTLSYSLTSERESYHRNIYNCENIQCHWTSNIPDNTNLVYFVHYVFQSIQNLKRKEVKKHTGFPMTIATNFQQMISNAAGNEFSHVKES
eukprot:287839_1